MTSGVGTPGTPSGDGAKEVDRGSAGAAAPATGSARIVMGMAFLWLTVVSFVLWLMFSRERDGLLLLTTLFLVAFFWVAGAFTKAFWSR